MSTTASRPLLVLAGRRDDVRTWANLVTAVRTGAAVPIGLLAAVHGSTRLLVAGYLVYWIGDIADGATARALGQETRIGAVFDIVSDRVCGATLAVALTVITPALWPAMTVFLLQFMVLDAALTLSFLYWPIVSPNDFAQVDPLIFRWNWSKPAKAINTGAVIVAAALGQGVIALVIALLMLAVKLGSARRLLRITAGPAMGSAPPR